MKAQGQDHMHLPDILLRSQTVCTAFWSLHLLTFDVILLAVTKVSSISFPTTALYDNTTTVFEQQ